MSIKKILMPIFLFSAVFYNASASGENYQDNEWRYYHARGVKQFNARMYTDSYDSMMKALRLNPSSFESANIIAGIAMIKKNKHQAIEYLEKSLSINDEQSETHTKLGMLLEYFGKDDEALAHFKRGYELENGNLKAMINLSRHLRKRGEKAEADRLFALCNDTGLPSAKPLFEKGKSINRARPAEAESLYMKAIELNPAYIDAYFALADLHRGEKRYEKAAETVEELKSMKSDYAPAYFYLGNIYYNNPLKGNTRKHWINLAISNIEEGLRIDPSSEDDYFHLGEIYRHIGDRDRAAELEKKGVELMRKSEQVNQ